MTEPFPLELFWLGPPSVRLHGQELRFRTQKTLALLVFLSCNPGPQSRENLAVLLWPDLDAEGARRELRKTLTYLQQSLGQTPFVQVSREHLRFVPEGAFCDSLVIQATHRNLRQQGHIGPDTARQLEATLTLWRGEFLEGFRLRDPLGLDGAILPFAGQYRSRFEEWLEDQRQSSRSQIETLIDQLSAHWLMVAQPRRSIQLAEAWTRLDPSNETAQRRLMTAFLQDGNPRAAQEVFDAFSLTFKRDIGSAPEEQVLELGKRIRRAIERQEHERSFRAALHDQNQALGRGLPESEYIAMFETRHRLYVALADWPGLNRELETLEQLVAGLGQPQLELPVRLARCDYFFRTGQYQQGIEASSQLLTASLPAHFAATLHYIRALCRMSLEIQAEAECDCRQALELAPFDWWMRGWALNTLAILLTMRNDAAILDQISELNAAAHVWFLARGEKHGLINCKRVQGPIHALHGDQAQALTVLEDALEDARELSHVFLERAVLETIVHLLLGRPQHAANAGVIVSSEVFLKSATPQGIRQALPWIEACLERALEPHDAFLAPIWQARLQQARKASGLLVANTA